MSIQAFTVSTFAEFRDGRTSKFITGQKCYIYFERRWEQRSLLQGLHRKFILANIVAA